MTDDPKMSFVSSCRLNGSTIYFIERFTPTFDESEVVMDGDRIPVFPTDEAARAEIARRFPLPRGKELTEQSSMEEVTAAMEDQYAPHIKPFYPLDAAKAWCKAPGSEGLTPSEALEIWELLFQVNEAPRPNRLDPMGMYAMHENIQRDPSHRDYYETILLGMKLSGIVIMAQRKGGPAEWGAELEGMGDLWPATDYGRLAAILEPGIARLEARFHLVAGGPQTG